MAVKEKKKKPQVEYEKQPESPTKKFDVTYAIVSVIAIIVLFSVLVTAYYKSNYIMFSPERSPNSMLKTPPKTTAMTLLNTPCL